MLRRENETDLVGLEDEFELLEPEDEEQEGEVVQFCVLEAELYSCDDIAISAKSAFGR